MYISTCKKYAYLATPRTGSNSIARLLVKNGFTQHLGHHSIDTDILSNIPNVVASVRYHPDIIVSWYYLMARKSKCDNCGHEHMTMWGQYLREFLQHDMPRRHAKYFMPGRLFGLYTFGATDLIYFETMAEDVKRIFAPVLDSRWELPFANKTERRQDRSWQTYYTPDQLAQIGQVYEREMRDLGYVLNPSHKGGGILQRAAAHEPSYPLGNLRADMARQAAERKQQLGR